MATIVLISVLIPLVASSSEASSGQYYSYTISTDGTIQGDYDPIGSGDYGVYTSVGNVNSGSWTWDENGYGPFNSYYAAFDPSQNNRMVCHLDPDDLTKSVDGLTDITGCGYNVMWCLPTVYWYTDSLGNLILTNDPESGGQAYAHTINGHIYKYVAIGVYESSYTVIDGKTILVSASDAKPATGTYFTSVRDYANNQSVNTDGIDRNGYAMIWNFYQWQLFRFCAVAVMGGWDSQSIAGKGASDGSPAYLMTGLLDTSGPYAGDTASYENPVKVFIENGWGSVSDFVDGLIVLDNDFYIDQSSNPNDSKSGTYVTHVVSELPPWGGYGSNPSTIVETWGVPTNNNGSMNGGLFDYISINSKDAHLLVGGAIVKAETPYIGISNMDFVSLSYMDSHQGSRISFVFETDPFAPMNTVSFISNGKIVENQFVPSGYTAIAPSVELYGYVFKGWFTSDGMEFSPDLIINSDMEFYARWEGMFQFVTDPTSDGVVSAIQGQPGTVSFKATPSLDYHRVLWDFGDGHTSTDLYATHYYSEPGTYTATLTVFNNHGSDATTYTIEVPSADGGGGIHWTYVVVIAMVCALAGAAVARRLL